MSKEKILEAFDEKFGNNEAFIVKQGLISSNEPQMMLSDVKHFISDLIDQTEEETIRKVEEAFYKTAGKYFLTQNMPIKNEKNMYLNKIEFWKLGVLDILNKLKK